MSDNNENSKIGWNIPASSSSNTSRARASPSRSGSPQTTDNYLLNIGKYLLKDVVFYGHYQEKRFVGPLSLYRDLIVISNKETELKKKLEDLKRVYLEQYPTQQMWLGVTDPKTIGAPVGFCIWTELEETPFGQYWFRIKRILLKDNEIMLKVKCLRQYDENDKKDIPKINDPEPWDNVQYNLNDVANNFKELFDMWQKSITQFILWFCSVQLTLSNSVAVVKFLALLVIALIKALVKLIQYFGDYSIKFMQQFNNLIQALTPFMMGVLNLIAKTIGGLYYLIAMMWKDTINPTAHRRQIQAIGPAQTRFSSPRFTRN